MSDRQVSTNKTSANGDLSLLTADRLTGLELIEAQLLCDCLQYADYKPTSYPVIMVAGSPSGRDSLLLSNLHHLLFEIPRENQRHIGCDQHTNNPPESGRFNHFQGGPILGNPADAITWLAALTKIGATDPYAVDFTYIKNPDLVDLGSWSKCFTTSIEFTRKSGVVVSFVRSTDSSQLDELLLILRETSHIRPIAHRSDLPSLEPDKPDSQSHLIIFKGEKTVRERR